MKCRDQGLMVPTSVQHAVAKKPEKPLHRGSEQASVSGPGTSRDFLKFTDQALPQSC